MPTMPVSLSVIDAPETDLHHHFEEIRFSLAPIYISVVSGGVCMLYYYQGMACATVQCGFDHP
jgi:hypothetical protein